MIASWLPAVGPNVILFLSMTRPASLSRRGFVAMTAASAYAGFAQQRKHIPIGLLIYAVLADWKKDFDGTLRRSRRWVMRAWNSRNTRAGPRRAPKRSARCSIPFT